MTLLCVYTLRRVRGSVRLWTPLNRLRAHVNFEPWGAYRQSMGPRTHQWYWDDKNRTSLEPSLFVLDPWVNTTKLRLPLQSEFDCFRVLPICHHLQISSFVFILLGTMASALFWWSSNKCPHGGIGLLFFFLSILAYYYHICLHDYICQCAPINMSDGEVIDTCGCRFVRNYPMFRFVLHWFYVFMFSLPTRAQLA